MPVTLNHLAYLRTVNGLGVFLNRIDNSRMVLFPGGRFQRGFDPESPRVRPLLDEAAGQDGLDLFVGVQPFEESPGPFLLDQAEISTYQWTLFVREAGPSRLRYPGAGDRSIQERFLKQLRRQRPDDWRTFPMVYVTWADAKAYLGWCRKDLPNEASWEAAARYGHNGLYPWGGDTIPTSVSFARVARYKPGGVPPLDPVDAGPAGPGGIKQMSGNVEEWCEDEYCIDPQRKIACSRVERSCRGGSWMDGMRAALTTFGRGHHVQVEPPRKLARSRGLEYERSLAQSSYLGIRGMRRLTPDEYAFLHRFVGR